MYCPFCQDRGHTTEPHPREYGREITEPCGWCRPEGSQRKAIDAAMSDEERLDVEYGALAVMQRQAREFADRMVAWDGEETLFDRVVMWLGIASMIGTLIAFQVAT